jgi:hypothetical protein
MGSKRRIGVSLVLVATLLWTSTMLVGAHSAVDVSQATGNEPIVPGEQEPSGAVETPQTPVGEEAGPTEIVVTAEPELSAPAAVMGPAAFNAVNWYVQDRIGIGTDAPAARLSVIGGPAWTSNFWTASQEFANGAAIGWRTNTSNQRFGLGHTNGGFYVFRTASDPGTTGLPAIYDFTIRDSGNVGIGNMNPRHLLSVARGPTWTTNGWGGSVELTNGSAVGWQTNTAGQRFGMGHTNGGFYLFRTFSDPGSAANAAVYDFAVRDNGFVGIGTTSPATRLHVNGTTRTNVLQITGGSDVAEPFAVAGAVEPGMVLAIDRDHPGQLRIANRAYDRTVAGVVSGAGGINSGLILQQEGSIAAGEHPVALTGRVYVWADATNGAIEPGDLLTTSNMPGHAMKVRNHTLAQGAILGKAMTGLAEGTGLVLVLVSLQ